MIKRVRRLIKAGNRLAELLEEPLATEDEIVAAVERWKLLVAVATEEREMARDETSDAKPRGGTQDPTGPVHDGSSPPFGPSDERRERAIRAALDSLGYGPASFTRVGLRRQVAEAVIDAYEREMASGRREEKEKENPPAVPSDEDVERAVTRTMRWLPDSADRDWAESIVGDVLEAVWPGREERK